MVDCEICGVSEPCSSSWCVGSTPGSVELQKYSSLPLWTFLLLLAGFFLPSLSYSSSSSPTYPFSVCFIFRLAFGAWTLGFSSFSSISCRFPTLRHSFFSVFVSTTSIHSFFRVLDLALSLDTVFRHNCPAWKCRDYRSHGV